MNLTPSSELSKEGWGWQEVTEDLDALSGGSVSRTLERVAAHVGAKAVVVSDVVPLLEFWGDESRCFMSEVGNAVEVATKYAQIDWGDFFLFASAEDATEAIGLAPDTHEGWYEFWVSRSLVVLRCVDDAYYYFYGTDLTLRDWVIATMRPTESKYRPLVELDFPL